MRLVVLLSLLTLAACATPTAPQAPSREEISAAVLAQMEQDSREGRSEGATIYNEVLNVEIASCRPAERGCFQCTYDVAMRHAGQYPGETGMTVESTETRSDMACEQDDGTWTLTPMDQLGS
jgi:hypothetical protein